MKASSRRPELLCPPADLLRRCVSLAVLDAILSPDWEMRYYSFDPNWGDDACMASMRNGSGDDLFIAFGRAGTFIKGFDHESKMCPVNNGGKLWPGMYEGLPTELHGFRDEPAFDRDAATFCMWWPADAKRWHVGVKKFAKGRDPDSSEEMLAIYDGKPETYVAYADDYFEMSVPLASVAAVYKHEQLDAELVAALNPDASFDAVLAEIAEWPYGE